MATFPRMETAGINIGGEMGPFWAALNTKKQQEGWGPREMAAFKSNFSKGQWPQARLFAAKFSDTKACNACVAKLCRENGVTWPIPEGQQVPPEILEAASTGTIFHRCWQCDCTKTSREQFAPEAMRRLAEGDADVGNLAFEKEFFHPYPP